ncbi:alpha/beta hydrolase (plasmid) [Deinococcus sp. KNUC1210]|uniref:alpha/beta fold hydrolase n=1 Tax=Deinococcus sp. KNUC1210 TaxID=2917691 RepID=UPI001EEF95FB|nr:alpha/beta hydrolase [Deinococcus sp. KNUC1210]ULH16979.1 alpha/beta hydrolase [Deinococcus sp. KNUC1210]
MQTVVSQDGTTIAYDQTGQGPAVILVVGALCSRTTSGAVELARHLSSHFTVINYDRRGRGDSGDTAPYSVSREVEDLAALIEIAGGHAHLYGHSSGAALVLEAALALGERAGRLALYEAPYNDDPAVRPAWQRYLADLIPLLAEGRRGDAVARFMQQVGTPATQIDGMRHAPFWSGLEAVAPTLAYDHAFLLGQDGSVPADRVADLDQPTLLISGGASFPFMRTTALTLAAAMPHASAVVLEGQTHEVDAAVLAPVLTDFFTQADVALPRWTVTL